MLKSDFLDYISGHDLLCPLKDSLLAEPTVSVRYNLAKGLVPDELRDAVPWCPQSGRYLDSRPAFTQDPALHQGLYYVQDASSMAICAAVKDAMRHLSTVAPRVLDVCAAPGGKTTAALSAISDQAAVVANEYDFRRAEILAENVAKWGASNTVIVRGDTAKLRHLEGCFDLAIVDAPCSGEGMMRKDPKACEQWSLALVDKCAVLQREILANAWPTLRPGGVLIYSTCTFNCHENERNVAWIIGNLGAESLPVPSLDACRPEIAPGIDTDAFCYRFIPGRSRGEGLFMAALRKPGDREARMPRGKSRMAPLDRENAKRVKDWLIGDFKFYVMGEDVFALPEIQADFMLGAASGLDVLSIGTWVATFKGRELVPAHALALSTALNRSAFHQCEVDLATAVAYLQRQAVTIDAPKGIVLLMYRGHPLGFVKNLGSRSNNLYPKNWRIRSQF